VIVLDASAALELLLATPDGARVAERVADPLESLHSPHLLAVEVAQVLRRYVRTGVLDGSRAERALVDLDDLDVARYDHEPLLPRMWELRDDLTAYDATYVALAEVLAAPLLTLDERMADSPGHRATIELVRRR
jgi:predicted nucleic acid-binding protein